VNRFLLFGHVNDPATAFTDLLEQFVAADAVAGFFGGSRIDSDGSTRSGRICCRALEEVSRFFTGSKEFFDPLTQGRVAGAGFIEISRARANRQPPGSAKDSRFAIRRVCHVQTALLSALQCENPEQMAQKSIGCPGSIRDTNKVGRVHRRDQNEFEMEAEVGFQPRPKNRKTCVSRWRRGSESGG
jgi:hypothetical protein